MSHSERSAHDKEWEARLAAIRPATGARVEYCDRTSRGVVLACPDARYGWAALVEWDEGSHLRSPDAFAPEAFHVGLVTVIT
jgi:hypothetical protein